MAAPLWTLSPTSPACPYFTATFSSTWIMASKRCFATPSLLRQYGKATAGPSTTALTSRAMTQLAASETIEGCPRSRFETWDPCNRSHLETPPPLSSRLPRLAVGRAVEGSPVLSTSIHRHGNRRTQTVCTLALSWSHEESRQSKL